MKKTIAILLLLLPMTLSAENRIYDPQVKSLQAVVNQDWLSPAVMRLGTDDVLNIGFDERKKVGKAYLPFRTRL